jgi:hypothetical protein
MTGTDGGSEHPFDVIDDEHIDDPMSELPPEEAQRARRQAAFEAGDPIGREFTAGQPDALGSGTTDRRDGRLRRRKRLYDWEAGVAFGVVCAALIGLLWRLLR